MIFLARLLLLEEDDRRISMISHITSIGISTYESLLTLLYIYNLLHRFQAAGSESIPLEPS